MKTRENPKVCNSRKSTVHGSLADTSLTGTRQRMVQDKQGDRLDDVWEKKNTDYLAGEVLCLVRGAKCLIYRGAGADGVTKLAIQAWRYIRARITWDRPTGACSLAQAREQVALRGSVVGDAFSECMKACTRSRDYGHFWILIVGHVFGQV